MNSGALRPDRAAARGRSTPNASHNEWHHTDRADRTTGARSINSPEKRARCALLRLETMELKALEVANKYRAGKGDFLITPTERSGSG